MTTSKQNMELELWKMLSINQQRSFYTFCYALALPIIILRLLWRSRKNPAYRKRINERLGFIRPLTTQNNIWVHAVSVGEIIAAAPLIKALVAHYPNQKIIVTTTTPTGSAQVQKLLGNTVAHFYTPYDLPCVLRRFITRANIKFCVIMETEIWPNMLTTCETHKVPIMLANARLSENSKKNYAKIKKLTAAMLQKYHLIASQSQADGDRFIALGANSKQVAVYGNVKFDLELPTDLFTKAKNLREQWQTNNRPVFIAASTHEGEDAIVIEAFKKIVAQHPNVLMILVPRHPENFDNVYKLCVDNGFKTARRSTNEPITADTQILLGDTMGELRLFFAASDIAFVAGSFKPIGGHNLIEPAIVGIPVLTGPHLHNFVEISELLIGADAATVVADADALATTVNELINNPSLCQDMGQRGKTVIAKNCGALERHLQWIYGNFPKVS